MEDLSLINFAPIIVINIIAIILIGILVGKKDKEEMDKILRRSDLAIEESEFLRKERRKLMEELEIEKERTFKLKMELQLEKDSLANKPCKPKPISRPRVSKYNKPNTLYIAYDFNISGNQSYAKIIKHIANTANNEIRPAVKTTSIVFFNFLYTSVFEDIILIKKNGASISIKKLYNNPEYYIDKDNSFFGIIFHNRGEVLNNLDHLLVRIMDNTIKFVKEKEL